MLLEIWTFRFKFIWTNCVLFQICLKVIPGKSDSISYFDAENHYTKVVFQTFVVISVPFQVNIIDLQFHFFFQFYVVSICSLRLNVWEHQSYFCKRLEYVPTPQCFSHSNQFTLSSSRAINTLKSEITNCFIHRIQLNLWNHWKSFGVLDAYLHWVNKWLYLPVNSRKS